MAGTDGHGVHGGSRGVCRRRMRGDVLTYQGTWLRPAGGPPIPKGGRACKKNRFDSITFRLETYDERPLPLESRNGYAPASESPADG